MTDLAEEYGTETELASQLAEALVKLTEAETKIANLEVALASNRRIGAAIGILMATRKVTEEQGFDLLRSASQCQHRKLRDVADEVVFTGVLDPG